MKKNENIEETIENTAPIDTAEVEASETASADTEEQNAFEQKYNDLYDKYLRTLAEYDNFKKRTQKEKEELSSFVAADVIGKLLPVMDNLERALSAAEEKTPFVLGVEQVYRQCFEIFEKMEVTKIEAVGKEFDPNVHNAVMHIEDENLGANVVAEELMAGYKYKEKVIRYSMVKVAN